MDEVEYQKRRSQKITGYVCDSFVTLYPAFTRKSEHFQLGVGWGGEAVSLWHANSLSLVSELLFESSCKWHKSTVSYQSFP